MAQDAFKLCIVYEDISRTQKLMKYINQVIEDLNWEKLIQIDECNLDEYDNCIIAISSTEAHCTDAPDVVMSRFSGSIAYRGNEALHDVILLLCKSQTGRTSVIKGTNCIQIENSKPLQMATLTSARFLNKLSASYKDVIRLPCTVLIRHLILASTMGTPVLPSIQALIWLESLFLLSVSKPLFAHRVSICHSISNF